MTLTDIGRALIGVGAVLAVLGVVLVLAGRAGLGRLPGDFSFGGDGVRVYVPLATCLLVSFIATVVLNLLVRR
ncbi:MAG TPA: DUF2905 domain-containing protein [Acidimicrobiales bacterium]|nr:DUF2905 domain-containing protein [Acidimicrobiales bacterium]HWI05041.1 DUF2905 domain-containing protein [Acidimicrobiales bacterium]